MSFAIPLPGEISGAAQSASATEIATAIDAVENLTTDTISEHVDAFEHVHRLLQDHLHGAVNG